MDPGAGQVGKGTRRAALALGIPQVAFLGHGLGRSTDPEARALRARIAAGGGAVASERFPEEGGAAGPSWPAIG